QISSFEPLAREFDFALWVGLRPGVRDTAGSTAQEALEDFFQIQLAAEEAVYTSQLYLVSGPSLKKAEVEFMARELLANEIIQSWRVIAKDEWDPDAGIGIIIPKVILAHEPTVTEISITSDAELLRISDERDLALNPNDVPTIREYFLRPEVLAAREKVGLSLPTDIELEYIAQARSDHCNHNTFNGLFHYYDPASGEKTEVNNLFKTYIEAPTRELAARKPWVASVLWDNAGVGRFDQDHYYTITGETHNSPSNMEAYGGAITGIVGVYRDPMGTGLGSRIILGTYGYCVGPRDYDGPLTPHLHPRRLLDGVIEGVKDGGNKSGIPTPLGEVFFHDNYMGKCLVFVTALGLMPVEVKGRPSEKKKTSPGELIIMCGGRVGKDGIHGVTASSKEYSEHTPAGHVQIGDPYTQKKMQDFLLEARDEGLIEFITDNGGGGLSSSIGESAMYSNGAEVDLDLVPLKYEGLDQWEIWVSESQERMTVAVRPENLDRFMALSELHAVKSTVVGRYTDTGKLHLKYKGKTCAYVDLALLESDFPQWEFEAEWLAPDRRGLSEPVLSPPGNLTALLRDMLSRPNICSKEWITRQYDHEVQGTSVIKPLVGVYRDTPSDAVVCSPVLGSTRGLAVTQAINPTYAAIDAFHMVSATIDEAVRRLLAVGADLDHIGGVDNFCWPNIQFDPRTNPDGKFKAAQLVRANRAMREACLAYSVPLLSGKDSMYVDGNLAGTYGERHKVSGLPTLQFTATSVIDDVMRCQTMDFKAPGDLIYVLGVTRDELGGSEYYDLLGYLGLNVPQTDFASNLSLYQAFSRAYRAGLIASARGIYRGGLGVHLAQACFGGDLGADFNLDHLLTDVEGEKGLSPDRCLFSESTGRFLVTVRPGDQAGFEELLRGQPIALSGRVRDDKVLSIKASGLEVVRTDIEDLRAAFKSPYGDLI
ncbi:MAG: phosphoribosylformylglycinamidine synthase, partial [Deltaproteobacteria bacterium]|nr:phosphoribosylformylglycinamidine synthase [Deltaproteobacteria bacterium]MBW2053023.1 phosphoribosylformylglycinamidine synthase [Deltaproteobacteria bacterium]